LNAARSPPARWRASRWRRGTGFLIAPQVLITNNHVLPDAATAAQATAQFHYEMDLSDAEVGPTSYRLAPGALFFTSIALDYTVVAVDPVSRDDATPLSHFGSLPLLETTGKASEGEWLTIMLAGRPAAPPAGHTKKPAGPA
jgi:endonuclease G